MSHPESRMDEARLRQFRNDLEDFILGAADRDPDKVARLARRAGITDPPDNHDVGVCVNIIVFEKARSASKLLDLLRYLPNVCGEFEKDKSETLNQLREELYQLYPEVRKAAGGPADSTDSADEVGGLFNAAIDVVRQTKELKLKFRTLLSSQELTRVDIEEISGRLTESASGIEEVLRAYPVGERAPSIAARRLLMSLGRIEEEIFRCFDSLWYYTVVHASLEESRSATANIGPAEADKAAAEMLRLRELNQARSQIRFRLNRITEECEFFTLR
jgi:hypothetical protein